MLLPKDYVRLRLTGRVGDRRRRRVGHAPPRRRRPLLVGRGARGAGDPRRLAAARPRVADDGRPVGGSDDGSDTVLLARRWTALRGVPVAVGAGDCAAAAVGVGAIAPGPLSVVLGTSGVVFATLPGYAADHRARVHAFCHAVPGDVARDGRDALGGRLAALVPRRGSRPASPFDALARRGRRVGARGRGAAVRAVPRRRANARMPTPTHAAPSPGSQLRHDRGALVRAVLEGVAFGLRDSLDLLRELGVEADRARDLGRRCPQRASGATIVASVLDLPIETTAADEGSAFGAALLGGVAGGHVRRRAPRPSRRCVRVHDVTEPDPGWVDVYAASPSALPHPLSRPRHAEGAEMNDFAGKVAVVTGASRGIGAAVAHALHERGASLGLASRSGDDLGLERVARAADRRPRPRAGAGARRRDGRAVRRDRHRRRERRRRRVRPARRAARRPPRRDDRHERQGRALRRRGDGPAPDRARRRRLRLGRLRGRPSRSPERGRLLRVEVRAGRASPGRSTTSCARTGSAAPTSARAACTPTSRSATTVAAPTGCRRSPG